MLGLRITFWWYIVRLFLRLAWAGAALSGGAVSAGARLCGGGLAR